MTWSLTGLLTLFGCVSLYRYVPIESAYKLGESTWWGYSLFTLPFFDVSFRVGLFISIAVFFTVIYLLNRFLINKPSVADFLIDTEYEVRKVSWPPKNEYWGSSVAVIISVAIIGSFIFVVDQILGNITKYLYTR